MAGLERTSDRRLTQPVLTPVRTHMGQGIGELDSFSYRFEPFRNKDLCGPHWDGRRRFNSGQEQHIALRRRLLIASRSG